MADQEDGTSQAKNFMGYQDGDFLAQGVHDSSSDHDGDGGGQTASIPDDQLREMLSHYLENGSSPNRGRVDHSAHSPSVLYSTTAKSSLATIAAENLSSQLHRTGNMLDAIRCTTPRMQNTSTIQYGDETNQEIDGERCTISATPPANARQITRMRDSDSDEDDLGQDPRDQKLFRSTDEEEIYLEEFHKAVGYRSAYVDEVPPEVNHQIEAPQPRRKNRPASVVNSELRTSRTTVTKPHSLSPTNTSHAQITPPPRPEPALRSDSHAQESSYQIHLSLQSNTVNRTPSTDAPVVQPPLANINDTNDPAVRNILENVTAIDLKQPRLTDRCRGMEYIPSRTSEELAQLRHSHIETLKKLVIRLHAAITKRLQATERNDARISIVGRALYSRAIGRLRSLFPGEDQYFRGLETLTYQEAQLAVLNRLMRRLDLTIRPNGPVHLQNSLVSWYIAATKWQIDIHEDWIAELESGKKRKRSGVEHSEYMAGNAYHANDNKDGAEGIKAQPRLSGGRASITRPRRPGRPPGSLNKSTIAAQLGQIPKRQKKQKPSLPPLSYDEVQLAQANAARYAKRVRSRLNPTVQSCSPMPQFQSQYQHLNQQAQPQRPTQEGYPQQHPLLRGQQLQSTYDHRRHTYTNTLMSRQMNDAQCPQSVYHRQGASRSISSPIPQGTNQLPLHTPHVGQYQPQSRNHTTLHPTYLPSQSPLVQNIDPAILYEGHAEPREPPPHRQSQHGASPLVQRGPDPPDLSTAASVNVHPNPNDLWAGPEYQEEDEEEEEKDRCQHHQDGNDRIRNGGQRN